MANHPTSKVAPLSPQPNANTAKEKPADPIDFGTNQEHARAPAREGHNSRRAAEDFANRIIALVDEIDLEIARLNARKSSFYAELRARGYDVKTIKWNVREGRIDPLLRRERDRKRAAYGGIGFNPVRAGGGEPE